MCIDSESLSIKNRRREKGCTRPIASESRGELMRFAGKSGSPRCNRARPAMTPWTIDKPTSPSPPLWTRTTPSPVRRPLSPSLAGTSVSCTKPFGRRRFTWCHSAQSSRGVAMHRFFGRKCVTFVVRYQRKCTDGTNQGTSHFRIRRILLSLAPVS